MSLFHARIAAVVTAMVSLAACVAPPVAPTLPVAPRPHKSFDAFAAEEAACQQYAAAQTAPAAAAVNSQAVGLALASSAAAAGVGAAIGAAAGNAARGAAIGAASGGALGIMANAIGAPPEVWLQQQFDSAYGRCMAARGNAVPRLSPALPQALEQIFPPQSAAGSHDPDSFG
jgi:hypothetical protein